MREVMDMNSVLQHFRLQLKLVRAIDLSGVLRACTRSVTDSIFYTDEHIEVIENMTRWSGSFIKTTYSLQAYHMISRYKKMCK